MQQVMAWCTAGSIPTECSATDPVRHLLLVALLLAPGCSGQPSPCRDGGRSCAAAQAPAGLRGVRKGYRILRSHWLEKTNRESGVPDIGIQAEWTPLVERR